MSGTQQTGDPRYAMEALFGERRVSEFLLYGINEAGQPVFSEVLRSQERAALPALAKERLRQWPGVEIWEGPMCLIRLARTPARN